MSNCPKFLICTNKKAASGRIFLVHTMKPSFVGELLTFKSLDDYENFLSKPSKDLCCEINGVKRVVSTFFEYQDKIAGLFINEFMDSLVDTIDEQRLKGLMERTSGWLQAYYSDNNSVSK